MNLSKFLPVNDKPERDNVWGSHRLVSTCPEPGDSNDCSCSFLYDKNQNSIVRNVRFTFLSLVFIAIFLASDTNLVYKSLD